jgi:hypothetical protein
MSTEELPLPRPRWWNEMVTSLRIAGFSVDAAFHAVRAVEHHVVAAERRGREEANENGELVSHQLIADAEERGRQAGLAEAIKGLQTLKRGES